MTWIPFGIYNHDTSQLCRTGHEDVLRTRMTTLSLSYFLSYFPLMVSDLISCSLHHLKTIWNIIMILHSYVEQVMTMCHVQDWQLSFLYFLSYLPLNETIRFCRRGRDNVLCIEYGCSCVHPPHPKKTTKKTFSGFGFFVKIHLLESSKLDL